MSGAGRFFLKLLDDGIRILPFVSARDFLSFSGIVNKPDCSDGLSQVLFDRDGVSVLKRFLHELHSFTVFMSSPSTGVNLPYLIFSQVARHCFVSRTSPCLDPSQPAFSCQFPVLASLTACCGVSLSTTVSPVLRRVFWFSLGPPFENSFIGPEMVMLFLSGLLSRLCPSC